MDRITLGTLLAFLSSGSATDDNSGVKFCPVVGSDYYDKSNDEVVQEFFECPGAEDPPYYTVCCAEKCCPVIHIDSVLGIDITIAMAISITVILLCLILGITMVVCCFWSPCPLYDTCGGGYKRRGGTVPFGDLDAADTDPLTSNGCTKYYTAQDVDCKVAEKAEHV